MTCLFENPIKRVKVRNGVFAYKYRNGMIEIDGARFYDYPMAMAIKIWRNRNK